MPIYSIHEDSERFRNIDFRAGNRASHKPKTTIPVSRNDRAAYNSKHDENVDNRDKQLSYPSGNIFESLAKTNPELFNKKKLEIILHSKNLVKDFNEYIASVFGNDIKRFDRFLHSIGNQIDINEDNRFKMQFNISLHSNLRDRYRELIEEYHMSEEEATKIVTQEYFPESLDEKAIRACIDTIIENNKCLTNNLTTILKQNYALFNLYKVEAEYLISDLENDDKNNEAIGKIKDFLKDPNLLKKFRFGECSYNFKSIGGGFLFLSEDDDIQFSMHPSKNLSLIFKYDAIVVAHGKTSTGAYSNQIDAASYTSKSIKENISLINKLHSYILNLLKEIETRYQTMSKRDNNIEDLYKYCKSLNNVKSMNDRELYELMQNMKTSLIKLANTYITTEDGFKHMEEKIEECEKIFHVIIARRDPKQAMKDGQAANWTMQPISTLRKSNLIRAVDIVRALKDEGFKNVYIGSCNPGGFTLPKELTQDKNFKVSYGRASVIKENFNDATYNLLVIDEHIDEYLNRSNSPYKFYTLNELYREYDILREKYPINEGILLDKLKDFFKKAAQIIAEIWKRIINFVKKIVLKIIELIKSNFGDNSNKKIKRSIEVTTIYMNDDKATTKTVSCNTVEEIQREVEKSNKSIQYVIQKYAKQEMEYMRKLDSIINRDKNNIHHESYSFFESIVFI